MENIFRRGTVKFFNKQRRFGFIASDRAERDVFFRLSRGGKFVCSPNGPQVRLQKLDRLPRSGDAVYFKSRRTRKGPEALFWGYADSYYDECREELARAELASLDTEVLIEMEKSIIANLMMPAELHSGHERMYIRDAPYNDPEDPDTFGMWNGVLAPILV